jgi:hypothetical protein
LQEPEGANPGGAKADLDIADHLPLEPGEIRHRKEQQAYDQANLEEGGEQEAHHFLCDHR